MQLLKAIIFTVLILGALTVKSQLQGKLIPSPSFKDKLSKSHMGKAIVKMLEVGATTGIDLEELSSALDLLQESLEKRIEAENADFKADGEANKKELARLNGLINSFRVQIIEQEDAIANLQKEKETLSQTYSNQQNQRDSSKEYLGDLQQQVAKINSNLEKTRADYAAAIELIQSAVAKLREAQGSSGDAIAFIQTNQEKYDTIATKLSQSFVQLKTNTVFAKPVINFFTQIKTGQPSVTAIDKAINALENLIAYYQKGLAQVEADAQAEIDQNTKLINSVTITIGDLVNNLIPKTEKALQLNADQQEDRQKLLDDANRNQRLEQSNLEQQQENWKIRVEENTSLIEQWEGELAIISQAETILANQFQ